MTKKIILVALAISVLYIPGFAFAGDKNSEENDRDLRNLTEHLEQQGSRVGWMKMGANADLSEWLESPYIFIRGFKAPEFKDSAKKMIKKYFEYGGALFGMARVTKTEGNIFEKPFAALASELCPGKKLVPLPADHPIYTIKNKIPAEYQCLSAIEDSCHIVILYSSRNLFKGYKPKRGEKDEVSPGMKLMENISEYITACGALREKLDKVRLLNLMSPKDIRSGMLVIPQMVKKADEERAHTMALPMMLEDLWLRERIRTATVDMPLLFKDLDPKKYPLVYLNSRGWEYTADEEKTLAEYVRKGGKVFAEALGGDDKFDIGFRKFITTSFAQKTDKFEAAPKTHYLMLADRKPWILQPTPELIKKECGEKGDPRKFRDPVFEILTVDGKPAIVYSKYDLACGWSDYPCFKRLGYSKKNALKMGKKIVKFLLGLEKEEEKADTK